MKTKKLLLLFLLASFCLTGLSVSAATQTQPATSQKATRIASVNIYSAKIVSQEKNKLSLAFNLSNREFVQPDVRYAVQLIRQDKAAKVLVDEKVYSEVINLGEKETISKKIDYLAPQYLNGKFQLWLTAKNASGMTLASVTPGEITLDGDNQYAEIQNTTCYLKVTGEAGDKKYFYNQGVDINSAEKLIATCDVLNNFASPLTLTPQIKTYWRSTFGKVVEDNKEPQVSMSFEAKKPTTLSFVLPKANVPQAYDAVLTLVDSQNKPLSNQIIFHYVLRGPSATIQNFTLNKSSYQKGDIANATFFWTPSADSFPGSRLGVSDDGRLSLQVEIKDAKGMSCINSTNNTLDIAKSTLAFNYPMIAACASPRITVSIKDASGNILDKKEYSLESQAMKIVTQKPAEKNTGKAGNDVMTYVIILVIVFLLISLALIYFKKKDSSRIARLGLFLFFVAGGLFFADRGVRADTFQLGGDGIHSVIFSASLDADSYLPGASIHATGGADYGGCSNQGLAASESVKINNRTLTFFSYASVGSYYVGYNPINPSGIVLYGIAESAAGNYVAKFYGSLNQGGLGELEYDVPYTVSASCTGANPDHATLCTGDADGLTADVAKTLVATCGTPKCEYTCNAGYELVAGKCELISDGICGPAATAYSAAATGFAGVFCNPGTPDVTPTAFPAPGEEVTWTCRSLTGGANSPLCTASRAYYSCGGIPPASPSIKCAGTDMQVTSPTDWHKVSTCNTANKCEYVTCTHGHTCSNPSCTAGVCETLVSACVPGCPGDCDAITCAPKTCPCNSGGWEEK